jgi:hypothetical protein
LLLGPEALGGLVDGELDEGEGDLRVFVCLFVCLFVLGGGGGVGWGVDVE